MKEWGWFQAHGVQPKTTHLPTEVVARELTIYIDWGPSSPDSARSAGLSVGYIFNNGNQDAESLTELDREYIIGTLDAAIQAVSNLENKVTFQESDGDSAPFTI